MAVIATGAVGELVVGEELDDEGAVLVLERDAADEIRGVLAIGQPLRGLVVTELRTFAQGEERLRATRPCPRLGYRHDFFEIQEGLRESRGCRREGAISTPVTTQLREGNEHLGGVGDNLAEKTSRPAHGVWGEVLRRRLE